MTRLEEVRRDLKRLAHPHRARLLQGFFKTGPGEYGAGDLFLGITVPELRLLAKKFLDLEFIALQKMLRSSHHEERLAALLILVYRYKEGDAVVKKTIFTFYSKNLAGINNWDLVDASAPYIVGDYLYTHAKNHDWLIKLAGAKNLWHRRIAIVATLHHIRNGEFKPTLKISAMLLHDQEDLIHKAVGWMLREVGKRDLACEERFLKRHLQQLPRTALRYAIERFPEKKRLSYLQR